VLSGIAFIFCFFLPSQLYQRVGLAVWWVAGPENPKFRYNGALGYFPDAIENLALFRRRISWSFPIVATQIYMVVHPVLYIKRTRRVPPSAVSDRDEAVLFFFWARRWSTFVVLPCWCVFFFMGRHADPAGGRPRRSSASRRRAEFLSL